MPSAKHGAWRVIGAHLAPPSALISFNGDLFLFQTYKFLLTVFSSEFTLPDHPSSQQPCAALFHHSSMLCLYFGLFESLFL